MRYRKDIVAVALLFFIACLGIAGYRYNISHLVMDWNLADVGQTYISAVSALEGMVPYRDFNYQWGPYALYLNVLAFKVLGIKISSVRLVMILTVIIITSLTYLLGRRFLSPFYAFLASLITFVTLIQNTLVPYANIYCIASGLASLVLIIEYSRTHRNLFIPLSGLLCGISLGLKLSAGLFITAGIIMAILVADGQYETLTKRASNRSKFLSRPAIITIFFIINAIILVRAHLNIKYFTLFIGPILISCFAALRLQGQFVESHPISETGSRGLGKSLLWLGIGVFAGSLPWICFYLFAVGPMGFFSNVMGSALEHSKHIFLPFPDMETTTIHMAGCVTLFLLLAWLIKKRGVTEYIWILVLAFAGASIWVFRNYYKISEWLGMIGLIDNITWFLSPITAIASSAVVIWSLNRSATGKSMPDTDARIIPVVLYQGFFFLVAYPHTEFTHLSWSYPTTMILLFFLLEKAGAFFVENWPPRTRRFIGKPASVLLVLSLPVLIVFSKSFPLLHAFYKFSPDLKRWEKKEYVKLAGERGGVYEFIESARQIESVDRFIQANTSDGDYLFEFPTTFFYYYSIRKNPSRWDYFYPGLNSEKQIDIISDVERAKPRLAIIYDNPYGWMFTYSKIRKSYPELANYIEQEYKNVQRIGYFNIMYREDANSD